MPVIRKAHQPVGDFAHIADLIDDVFDILEREIESRIEGRSGFAGPVRDDERELSEALDQIAAYRDEREMGGGE